MKRSEANEILKSRIEFSTKYDCFSTFNDDPDYSLDTCECCGEIADTTLMTYLSREDINKKQFDNVYEDQICNGCIISMIYSDDSDLDYHVTDEDLQNEDRMRG